ncbi:hypothetical protein C8J57DRAFT_1229813 [Mycena rebaudengoi]|nr:hypothetical protein C8J57DRAFT_1229813 [Mycena rebaudengoi]
MDGVRGVGGHTWTRWWSQYQSINPNIPHLFASLRFLPIVRAAPPLLKQGEVVRPHNRYIRTEDVHPFLECISAAWTSPKIYSPASPCPPNRPSAPALPSPESPCIAVMSDSPSSCLLATARRSSVDSSFAVDTAVLAGRSAVRSPGKQGGVQFSNLLQRLGGSSGGSGRRRRHTSGLEKANVADAYTSGAADNEDEESPDTVRVLVEGTRAEGRRIIAALRARQASISPATSGRRAVGASGGSLAHGKDAVAGSGSGGRKGAYQPHPLSGDEVGACNGMQGSGGEGA